MRPHRLILVGLIAAGSFCALPAVAKGKKGNKAPAQLVGPAYVDFGRLIIAYRKTPAYAKLRREFQARADELRKEMDGLQNTRYLTPEELLEHKTLSEKLKRSKKEQARLDSLGKRSDDMDQEFRNLSVLTELTDAQQDRLAQLTKVRQEAIARLRQHAARLDAELNKLDTSLRGKMTEQLLKVIAKVAKSKKWGTVYERAAVLYGGTDVTEDVIKRLPQ